MKNAEFVGAGPHYSVDETADGFIVSGKGRVTTRVTLTPYGFEMETDKSGGQGGEPRFGLCDYYALSKHIAELLMWDWKLARETRNVVQKEVIRRWAKRQCARTVGKRVHAQWRRLLRKADPRILAVQSKLFAVSMDCPEVAFEAALYDHPVIDDVLQYRAAAIAVAEAHMLFVATSHRSEEDQRRWREALAEAHATDDYSRLNEVGTELAFKHHRESLSDMFEQLKHWRGMFSRTGVSYRSLDRTLMNLPGRVPSSLFAGLRHVMLPRPITDRLELTAVLFAVHFDANREDALANQPVWLNASNERIRRAMQRVAEHTHSSLSPNRTGDIRRFVRFVLDGDDNTPYPGTIVGLADRAIGFHRYRLQEYGQRTVAELGNDTAAHLPPVALPNIPGIRFLDTVGNIVEEGVTMNHCIASYAKEAVDGNCFLFHVEHDGEEASVEVNRLGIIQQVGGPSNHLNEAAIWGGRALANWGRQFPRSFNLDPLAALTAPRQPDQDRIPD